MTEERSDGYYPTAVFAQELTLVGNGDIATLPENASLGIGWDWYPHDARVFDVLLQATVPASQTRPEEIRVVMVARFERVGTPQPAFAVFAMLNAPTLLVPYVRETISSLSSRGLLGPILLPTINVIQVMSEMKMEASNGFASLIARPALAEAYGFNLAPS